jgi:hypothetical protein
MFNDTKVGTWVEAATRDQVNAATWLVYTLLGS